MRAAAAGNSTIGIPQRVGKEFVAADRAKAKHNKHAKNHDKPRRVILKRKSA